MAFRLAEAYVQFSQRGLSRVNSAARSVGGSFRSAVGVAGRFAGILGTMGMGVGFGAAIKTVASFEQQMSAVKAVTGATDEQFKDLEATARQLGADTAFSASEAASGMEFLARAGFETDQIISAMPATLDLALSGALGLGDAADIASNALTGFGLGAGESNRVADVLALTAASANTNVRQLGDGLKFVAPISAGLGVSIEDTSAAIGALSDAGLQGEMAGTGLRKILSGLADPSDTLKKKMNGLTLEGDGLIPVLKALAENGISTSEGMAEFGERGGPAIGVLTSSATKIEALAGSLGDAEGTAKRLAATMSDNLAGSSKQAVSAFQELTLIAGDSGLKDAARSSVEAITEIFRSEDMKIFAEDIGILVVETGENIGIMSDKFFDALGSIGLSFGGVSGMVTDAWETFKFFSRNFGTIWDIAVEMTSIGISNTIERISTLGTNMMEIGSWMVGNWRSIFVDMLNAQSTILVNIGANLKEFLVQIKSWLAGDGFNFEVTGLLDGFERTTPELPPLTQPVVMESSEELDRLLDKVGQAEVEHTAEQEKRDKDRAERKEKLANQEIEQEEKKEKTKQKLAKETDDKKKALTGDAESIFQATREAIEKANEAKTGKQDPDKTGKQKPALTTKEINKQAAKFESVKESSLVETKLSDSSDTKQVEAHLKTGIEIQREFVNGLEKVEAAVVKAGKKKGSVWS